DILAGLHHPQALCVPALATIFTPTWNRCTEQTASCLVELEFSALSRTADAVPYAAPTEIPVTVDWSKRDGLGKELASSAEHDPAVGVMLHHELIDAEDRLELDALLDL